MSDESKTSEEKKSSSSEEDSEESEEKTQGQNERTAKAATGTIRQIIKIGVVGDGTVGKTTLLLSYITNAFLTDYTPTVFDNFSAIENVDGALMNVILWDTAGQDDYKTIRTTCYEKVNYDIFLLCFSVVHRDSFENVKYKWLEELKAQAPNTPYVLVGTKTDLRKDDDANHISFKEGEKRCKEIKAKAYLECTATSPPSVTKMIVAGIHILTDPWKREREKNLKKWAKQAKKEEKEEAKRIEQYKKQQEQEKKDGGGKAKGKGADDKKEATKEKGKSKKEPAKTDSKADSGSKE